MGDFGIEMVRPGPGVMLWALTLARSSQIPPRRAGLQAEVTGVGASANRQGQIANQPRGA